MNPAKEDQMVVIQFDGSSPMNKPVNVADLEFFVRETMIEEEALTVPNWAEELFEVQERLEMGSVLALHEGISVCNEAQIPLPIWLAEELQRLTVCLATNERYEIAGRGRANSTSARMREELKQYLRQDAVNRVRGYQALRPCLLAFMILPVGLRKLYNGKPFPDLGHTVEEAVAFASISLRGTFAQASEETVRKAYSTPSREGWGPWPFTRQETLEAIGVLPENNPNYLPEGFKLETADTDNPFFGMLPSALFPGAMGLKPDAQSIDYIEKSKLYSDFKDFLEAERKVRSAE